MNQITAVGRPAGRPFEPTSLPKSASFARRPGSVHQPTVKAVFEAAPVSAAFSANEQGSAALSLHMLHPRHVQAGNLVPALRAVLLDLRQPVSGGLGWEPGALTTPLLLGLLSWATTLIEQPRTAAALGPEAPLLLLEALSHVAAGAVADTGGAAATRQAQHCRKLWRHAHVALGDAADQAGVWTLHDPELMSTDMVVRYYEACARGAALACSPSKSPGLGLLLKSHLLNRRLATDEAVRLLVAWAQLRRCMPFNPDTYAFADLAALLAERARQLSDDQLQQVAAAAPAFQWPVYRSMPLLHVICREAVHRSLAGVMPLPPAQRTLAAAFFGVAATQLRLAHELQAASCEWMRSAPAGPDS